MKCDQLLLKTTYYVALSLLPPVQIPFSSTVINTQRIVRSPSLSVVLVGTGRDGELLFG